MGRAFVAKLARKGARDPEALAAWIGRQKWGKTAFQRLAKAGRDDAKAQRQLMGRIRPGGQLAGDLTGFSDQELGRALSDLSPAESGRVAAEMDRRDAAATLPGVRPDLIGVSDEELGQRLATADGTESAAIAAEMDRRQRVAEVFPGGSLAADLSRTDEGTLGWALAYARPDEAQRIAAEVDRREPVAMPVPSATGDGVTDYAADRAALEMAAGDLPAPEQWGRYADDGMPAGASGDDQADGSPEYRAIQGRIAAEIARYESEFGFTPSEQQRERIATDIYAEAQQEYERDKYRRLAATSTREKFLGEMVTRYQEFLDQEMIRATNAEDSRSGKSITEGRLVNAAGDAAGIRDVDLWSGPQWMADRYATEELKAYWETVSPRVTISEFVAKLTGTEGMSGANDPRGIWRILKDQHQERHGDT